MMQSIYIWESDDGQEIDLQMPSISLHNEHGDERPKILLKSSLITNSGAIGAYYGKQHMRRWLLMSDYDKDRKILEYDKHKEISLRSGKCRLSMQMRIVTGINHFMTANCIKIRQ